MLFPDIDPIAFSIGPIAIRWYALAYIAGILLGWRYIKQLNPLSPHPISDKSYEAIISWSVLGILLGGRLGYVLFYHPSYYFQNPTEILMLWKGGMSFHGGALGMLVAMWGLAHAHQDRPLALLDLIACAAPIGLFFGRIANFINAELYGRPTEHPIGIIFPHSDGLARHPSQLYEAMSEGFLLFFIMFYLVKRMKLLQTPGYGVAVFLIGYGLSRTVVECFREPDIHIGYIADLLTMGQILSVPMILVGLYILIKKPFRT